MKTNNHESDDLMNNHFSNIVHTGSDVSLSNQSFIQSRIMASGINPDNQDFLKVSIKDTGLGMKEETIKGLF